MTITTDMIQEGLPVSLADERISLASSYDPRNPPTESISPTGMAIRNASMADALKEMLNQAGKDTSIHHQNKAVFSVLGSAHTPNILNNYGIRSLATPVILSTGHRDRNAMSALIGREIERDSVDFADDPALSEHVRGFKGSVGEDLPQGENFTYIYYTHDSSERSPTQIRDAVEKAVQAQRDADRSGYCSLPLVGDLLCKNRPGP